MSTPTVCRRVVVASMAGTVVEWYEFFLYGTRRPWCSARFSSRQAPANSTRSSRRSSPMRRLRRPSARRLVFGHYGDKYAARSCSSSPCCWWARHV